MLRRVPVRASSGTVAANSGPAAARAAGSSTTNASTGTRTSKPDRSGAAPNQTRPALTVGGHDVHVTEAGQLAGAPDQHGDDACLRGRPRTRVRRPAPPPGVRWSRVPEPAARRGLGAQPASAAHGTAANRSAGHRSGPGPFGLPRQPRPAGCVSIEWSPVLQGSLRMLRNTPSSYGSVAKLLHWSIVVLIITQVVLGISADDLPNGLRKLELLAWHKSFGMLILMLALVRLAWRYANPRPVPPADMPRWQRLAAVGTHRLLYALILLQPLTGWLMSSYKNYPVSFFGLFQWPDLVAPDAGMHELFEEVHEWLARLLVTVAIVHASAALYHHFGRKDDVLRRMLPFTGALLLLLLTRGQRPGGDRLAYGRGGQPAGVPRHAGRRGIRGPLQALRAGDPLRPGRPGRQSFRGRDRHALGRHAGRRSRRGACERRLLRHGPLADGAVRDDGVCRQGRGQVRGPRPSHDPRRDAGRAAAVHVSPRRPMASTRRSRAVPPSAGSTSVSARANGPTRPGSATRSRSASSSDSLAGPRARADPALQQGALALPPLGTRALAGIECPGCMRSIDLPTQPYERWGSTCHPGSRRRIGACCLPVVVALAITACQKKTRTGRGCARRRGRSRRRRARGPGGHRRLAGLHRARRYRQELRLGDGVRAGNRAARST